MSTSALPSADAGDAPSRPVVQQVTAAQAGAGSIIFGAEFQLGSSSASASQQEQLRNLTTVALASLAKFTKARR
jgi:hypothetical protein